MTRGDRSPQGVVVASAPADAPPAGAWADLLILGVAAVAWMVAGWEGIADGFRLGDWMQAHHQFSYEVEFIRRGLPGEMLRRLSFPNEPRPMYALSLAIYAGFALALGRLAWDALSPLARRPRAAAVALLLLLPFALPHFAYDLGRYDVLLYLVVLLLIRWPSVPWPVYGVVGVAGVLVHETFVLVHAPLLVAAVHHDGIRIRAIGRDRRFLALLAGAAGALALVVAAGDMDSMTEAQFHAYLQEKVPSYDEPLRGAPHRLLFDTPGTALRRTLDEVMLTTPAHVLAAAVPGACLAWCFRQARGGWLDGGRIWLAVAPALGLFLAGHDFTRWVALVSTNLLVVLLVIWRDRPLAPDDAARAWRAARLPTAVLAATVLAGPVGTTRACPLLADAAQSLL